MKTAIIYYSKHQGNTLKLLNAIAKENDVCLIDATKGEKVDFSAYDAIGFASGIYFSKFHKSVVKYAEEVPAKTKEFFICTYGAEKSGYLDDMKAIANKKHADVLGTYGCLGLDKYGPFKLIGGIAKGHPTQDEINGAADFYNEIVKNI